MDILIVDDNQDLADGLAVVLESEGHQTSISYSGVDVLEKIKKQNFDLVLLDAKLPGISGVEIYYQIQKQKLDVQVIIITAYRIDQFLSEAMGNCRVEILHKPFSKEQLLNKLESIKNAGILLVNANDPEFTIKTKLLLQENNYKPTTADNKLAAIENITTSDVDVLLFDLKQPVLHGIDIYFDLKERGISLPIIFNAETCDYQGTSADVFHSLSVTGCIFKPFTPDELLHGIESLCAK